MNEAELLERIAQTLRQEIGPAIDAEYPKTQAFMAAVVLQKLGQQLKLAALHEAAEHEDLEALLVDLNHSAYDLPVPVQAAVENLARHRNKTALCTLIESLYAARTILGDDRCVALLGRVRQTLRADIDRQVEYAA